MTNKIKFLELEDQGNLHELTQKIKVFYLEKNGELTDKISIEIETDKGIVSFRTDKTRNIYKIIVALIYSLKHMYSKRDSYDVYKEVYAKNLKEIIGG